MQDRKTALQGQLQPDIPQPAESCDPRDRLKPEATWRAGRPGRSTGPAEGEGNEGCGDCSGSRAAEPAR